METKVQGITFLKKYEKHEQKIFSTNKILFQHISCTYARHERAGIVTRGSAPPEHVLKNNSSKTYPMDVLHHSFIRLGLARAKALQTARRFPRETRRRSAVPKSKAFTLYTYGMVPRDAFRPSKKAKTCTFMGRKRWRTSRFCK